MLLSLASSCSAASFDPPKLPSHERDEDGYQHALGLDYPFLCPDPVNPLFGVECEVRPRSATVSVGTGDFGDAFLSCDAIGCHGGYDYRSPGGATPDRHLYGSEGPSCFTCHDREWKKDEPKSGRYAFGEKEDD